MLIDAHTHVDLYGENESQALEEIKKYEIFSIANSMDPDSYQHNLELAEGNELILPIFGIHPLNASHWVDQLSNLDWAFEKSPMYGEIGLDSRIAEDDAHWRAQTKVFQYFLKKAQALKKIVIVHSKGTEQAVANIIEQYELSPFIMHWYNGPLDIFRAMAHKGTYFTIGVEILFSDRVKDIARELPLEQLLTETDNPVAKVTLRNLEGSPRNIIDVVSELAAVKNTTVDRIIDVVHENFKRLIQNDPQLTSMVPG